jgi:hypothetical protein
VQVIVNADDFGISHEATEATIACFAAGGLTSATIMAGGAAAEEALAFARDNPQHSFGAHLVFVGDGEDVPLAPAGEVPALVDTEGRLLPTSEIRRRALLGRLPAAQLATEAALQIDRIRAAGVPVGHVDSHRHVHKLRPFREALRQVLPRFGITRVRSVQDVYLGRALGSPTYWLGRAWQRDIARSFVTTAHFYMPSSTLDVGWAPTLLERMAGLSGTTIEVGVHPGTAEEWRVRESADVVAFTAAAVAAGHELTTWGAVT